jgi:hypothetical protein
MVNSKIFMSTYDKMMYQKHQTDLPDVPPKSKPKEAT